MPLSADASHLHLHYTQIFRMENQNPSEIALDDEAGATSKTRTKSTRSKTGHSSSNLNPDANAAVIQQVSSLKASLVDQQEQLATSNATVSKLSDVVGQLSAKFDKLFEQSCRKSPEQVYLSDSEVSEVEEPVSDLFAGLFDEGPTGEPGPEDVWTTMLSSTEAPAEFGPELPADIAASMQRVSISEQVPDKVKAWKARYLIPVNVKNLASPKVNPEIWALLDASRRSQDQQYQNCQTMLSLSLVAQSQALATIREWHRLKQDIPAADIVKKIGEVLMDSVSCIGMAQGNLNLKRRGLIKQAVPALKNISFAKTQPTEYLFGDRVQDELKTAKAAHALMRPDVHRKRRPTSGVFGAYSGGYSRQFRDKRARPQPTLNFGGDSQRPRSSGSRKQPPQPPKKLQ